MSGDNASKSSMNMMSIMIDGGGCFFKRDSFLPGIGGYLIWMALDHDSSIYPMGRRRMGHLTHFLAYIRVTVQDPSPPTENGLRSATGAEESEREDLKSYGIRW